MKIGIAADDLTSASDGAAPFLSNGHTCEVWFDHQLVPSAFSGVLSIDKDSRARTRAEAVQRSRAAMLKLADADILYQTVDSTIRGHVEAEVLAALATCGRKSALFAPAFPNAGRTTVNGEQLLNGMPVNRTAFALDPMHPVASANISGLFVSIRDHDVRLIRLAEVRALQPSTLQAGPERLLIADAETQDDLNRLVMSVGAPRDMLFCGSPGMARALAHRFRGSGIALPKSPSNE